MEMKLECIVEIQLHFITLYTISVSIRVLCEDPFFKAHSDLKVLFWARLCYSYVSTVVFFFPLFIFPFLFSLVFGEFYIVVG